MYPHLQSPLSQPKKSFTNKEYNSNSYGKSNKEMILSNPSFLVYSPGQDTTNTSSLQQSLLRDQSLSENLTPQTLVSQFGMSQQQQNTPLKEQLQQSYKQQSQQSLLLNSLNIKTTTSYQPSCIPQITSPSKHFNNNKVGLIDKYNGQGVLDNISSSSSVLSSKITSPTYQPMPVIQGFSSLSSSQPIPNQKIASSKELTSSQQFPKQDQQKNTNQPIKAESPHAQQQVIKTQGNQNSKNSSNSIIQNTQGNRNDNSFCSSGSRRFSFFSKTSCATGVSQIYGASQFRRSNQSVPRVNITNIIKKRAYLYLDEGLANTFDELLESGYNIVLNKKHERDEVRLMEDSLKMEVDSVQKEITPLYIELSKTHQQLEYYNDLYQKQIAEHQAMESEIQMLKELIAHRQHVIELEESNLSEEIKQSELEINNIRTQILLNKATHKQDRDYSEKQLKSHKIDLEKITEFLSEQKTLFEAKKQDQASRLRKMENKSKMYLGILKH